MHSLKVLLMTARIADSVVPQCSEEHSKANAIKCALQ